MIISFLNKPFPGQAPWLKSLITNFFIGCFISLFLIVFKPFGIDHWETPNRTLKLAGFGLVSFIVPVIVSFLQRNIIPKKISEDNWKVGYEIIEIILILLFIALGNLIYGHLIGIMYISFNGFIMAFMYTLLIGIFPVVAHVTIKHNKLLTLNTSEAVIINSQLQKTEDTEKITPQTETNLNNNAPKAALIFVAENEKDKIELEPSQLLYIESADNYSNIIYIESTGEEKIKKQMIRSSLKRLESQYTVDYIMRCHRTYIVNLKNVKKIEGNAAGYKLSFINADYSVPVSRNFGASVIEKLKIIG